MDEPTPDHYKALGVDKAADASTIKATYRKLVLKCHPDKVTDPALKEQKQEEFHQIQQAYECLIDDEKRGKYDALVTLEKLRKEKAARGPAPRDRTARFDVPTSGGASFAASGPTRYTTEHRVPTTAREEDERYYARYHRQPSKPSAAPRSTREKESSKSSRHVKEDRSRSDREKTRAKEARSDRKFTSVESESSSDEKARYETAYKNRTEEDARRRAEERRTYEDNRYAGVTHAVPAQRKMSVQEQEALRYQHKSRAQVEEEMSSRPSSVRTSSRDYYNPEPRLTRRDSARPEPVRRSSARPSKERPSMPRRDTDRTDRGIPEVVEWADDRYEERRVPSFKQTTSSPAELARRMPQRSYTDRSTRHAENTPPSLSRSSTMPNVPHVSSSSRRKESTVPRGPSGLRETMTPEQYSSPEKYTSPEKYASPERDAFPTVTPSSTVKTYYYPVAGGGVSAGEAPSPTPRHVVREPQRQHRSKSPIGKPPIGPNRPAEPITAYKRPSMPGRTESSRTESSRNISPIREDRGRSGRPKLYGEVSGESRHRVRQTSIDPNDVQYARRYGPEDVRWAPRSSEADRGYASKPQLGRTATYVY